ncbi:hypothetical protein HDU87_002500 [Geranomyces variabilis]|uniref:Uncharacterized protein n=1 Tax=Geranomyces variabilis TaxID=109894 RepID=A0AAD5TRR8_9FUNG|nr:hypothetical protein HDU87_002500 [Geranomyces variabilis]
MSSSKRKFQAVAARSSASAPSGDSHACSVRPPLNIGFQKAKAKVVSLSLDRQRSARGAVLDDAARRRAQQQHIEELQQDNFNEASTVVDLTAADTDNLSAAARRKRGGLADDDVVKEHLPAARRSQKKASVKRILSQRKNLATLVHESVLKVHGIVVCEQLTCVVVTLVKKKFAVQSDGPARFRVTFDLCLICAAADVTSASANGPNALISTARSA